MVDTRISVFQAAMDFYCSGRLSPTLIDGREQTDHPLLQFADRYDLQDLIKDYLAMAERKVPLRLDSVAWHLQLAITGNNEERKPTCIALVAEKCILDGKVRKAFLEMTLENATTVLSHDELSLPRGREHDALVLWREWVGHRPERVKQAHELLQGVRLRAAANLKLCPMRLAMSRWPSDLEVMRRTGTLWTRCSLQTCGNRYSSSICLRKSYWRARFTCRLPSTSCDWRWWRKLGLLRERSARSDQVVPRSGWRGDANIARFSNSSGRNARRVA